MHPPSPHHNICKPVSYLSIKHSLHMDTKAAKQGCDPSLLMEGVGHEMTTYIQKYIQKHSYKQILVLCGPGHNGGDGLVVARVLKRHLISVKVYLFAQKNKITSHPVLGPKFHLLQHQNVPVVFIPEPIKINDNKTTKQQKRFSTMYPPQTYSSTRFLEQDFLVPLQNPSFNESSNT